MEDVLPVSKGVHCCMLIGARGGSRAGTGTIGERHRIASWRAARAVSSLGEHMGTPWTTWGQLESSCLPTRVVPAGWCLQVGATSPCNLAANPTRSGSPGSTWNSTAGLFETQPWRLHRSTTDDLGFATSMLGPPCLVMDLHEFMALREADTMHMQIIASMFAQVGHRMTSRVLTHDRDLELSLDAAPQVGL